MISWSSYCPAFSWYTASRVLGLAFLGLDKHELILKTFQPEQGLTEVYEVPIPNQPFSVQA